MTPADLIREGRNQLFERGWTQNATIGDDGSVCALAALSGSEGLIEKVLAAQQYLVAALPGGVGALRPVGAVVLWNDAPERTFGEVVDLFDRAEKLAEADEVAS